MNKEREEKPVEETPSGEAESKAPEEAEKPGTPDESAPAEDAGDRHLDRLKRLQAEFENYRKRIAREQAEWSARAVERMVLELLPAVDSFDRALATAEKAEEESPILAGMMLVHKQLLDALKSQGIEPFESVGEPFDPNRHDAFMSRPAEGDEEPGTIVEEFVKGYRMGDRTIRPAKGIVAVRESGPETEEE